MINNQMWTTTIQTTNLQHEPAQTYHEQDWRAISTFPDYEVHPEYGIRGKKRKKILKGRTWLGYPRVTLMRNGKKNEVKIHRIMAQEFLTNPNPTKKWIVNHKDGNRQNFKVSNLEWVTPSENQIDRWERAKTGWNVKYTPEYGLYKTAASYFKHKFAIIK